MQTEYLKTIDVSNLPEGEYTLFLDLKYEGQKEPATTQRKFVIRRSLITGEELVTLSFIGFLIVCGAVAYLKRNIIFHSHK